MIDTCLYSDSLLKKKKKKLKLRHYEIAHNKIDGINSFIVMIKERIFSMSSYNRIGGQNRRPRGLSSVSLVLLIGISESTGQQV